MVAFGAIPRGAMVRHRCDNPPCINPDHLLLGGAQENAQDRVDRKRFDYRSKRYNRVKLDQTKAREIRAAYGRGGITMRELGHRYGVGRDQISRVINNLNWKEQS